MEIYLSSLLYFFYSSSSPSSYPFNVHCFISWMHPLDRIFFFVTEIIFLLYCSYTRGPYQYLIFLIFNYYLYSLFEKGSGD